MTREEIMNIVHNMPEGPGVYKYFNSKGKIIYVGKAKNLKRRVSSYFNKDHSKTLKTKLLVENIDKLEYIVVESEQDAFLLENNLIKENNPHYNILLKDGKTYPSICITKEEYPRVFKTRNIIKGAGEYFGPYSYGYLVDSILELIREIYPIRTCRHALTTENIEKGKWKLCLEYHMKRCYGPCKNLQSKEDYREMIGEVREIIKGNVEDIQELLLSKMKTLAEKMKFEEAEVIKIRYLALDKYKAKSVIVDRSLTNLDVFSYDEDEKLAYINVLHIVKGSIVQGETVDYKKGNYEEKEEILGKVITGLREKINSTSKEIIVPFLPDSEHVNLDNAKFVIPVKGDKKKLLDLSMKNVLQYKFDRYKQIDKLNPEQRKTRVLTALKNTLNLPTLPHHIECFDNSNISGKNAVAGCVVYKEGKASKKDYRKYNITTVEGPDDYASMKEVVERRYSKMKTEGEKMPDLIITDGGKGQMNAVKEIVIDKLELNIPIAGLAKNDKHRTHELFYGFPPKVVYLRPTEELFRFLTGIQDEVHRYAISFHRNKRSKAQIHSELDDIKGIGEKTKDALIKHFKSVKRIKETELKELEKIVGNNKASIIYDYFKSK